MSRLVAAFVVIAAVTALAGVLIARSIAAAPWVGPVSDHFDGRKFTNLDPTRDKSMLDLLRWKFTAKREEWASWVDEAPAPRPIERVNDRTVRVTWVNHATMLVQLDGVNILTDPVWSDRVSPVSFAGPRRHRMPGIRFEDLPPIDVVVVSHNHYDHMDLPTLRRLAERFAMPIVAGLGNASYLSRREVTGARDVDWWDEVRVNDSVRVIAVPARHWSARTRSDLRHTLWNAYVIEGPSGRVYFSGDTGYGVHFAMARQRLGPMDVALMSIGAFQPEWFMHEAHMSPAEAVKASSELGARVSIPMHFGTWQLGDDGDAEPLRYLEDALTKDPAQRQVWRTIEHGRPFTMNRP
jgi:L-ascorbate metabolism protein UlaG (beta-lactamase superfamily)